MGATSRQTHAGASILARASVGISRDLLEATLDLVPVPALLVEPGTARTLFANEAAHTLAGGRFPQAEEAARYAEMYPLTDPDGTPLASDSHPAVRAARGERIEGCQVEWRSPAGNRSLLVSAEALPPADGRDALVVVAFEDVSPIRRAEAETRSARALLDAFFGGASVGMAFLDRELRFQRVNDALAALNGIPAADHIGRTAAEVLPEGNP